MATEKTTRSAGAGTREFAERDHVGASATGVMQVRKLRADGWTRARREAFLDHLAATSNLLRSAEAVGMSPAGLYALRRRDPVFEAAYVDAMQQAYGTIEARLLAHAAGQPLDQARKDVPEGAPFDPDLAIKVLNLSRKPVDPNRAPRGPRAKRATLEQVEASLERKLDALAKRIREKV